MKPKRASVSKGRFSGKSKDVSESISILSPYFLYYVYIYIIYPTNLSDSLAAVFCCLLSRHQHFWVHSLLLSFATGCAD